MFRSTGVFNELMCPDSQCIRPYCTFWHDPVPAVIEPQASSSVPANVPVTTHQTDLYNPYTQEFPSFSGYSASLAQPVTIPSYSVESTYNGYIASEESNEYKTDSHKSSEAEQSSSINIEEAATDNQETYTINIKTEPIDEEEIFGSEPISKEPEEQTIPNSDKSNVMSNAQAIKKVLSYPEKPGNLLECAKSISEIDAEIERLKQLRQQHKEKAAELRGPINIREDSKPTKKEARPVLEYVPKKIKSEKPSTTTGSYIPTPLAELERKKALKRKAVIAKNDREVTESVRVKRTSSSNSELSQEDLFGEEVSLPSKKKSRVEHVQPVTTKEEVPEAVAIPRRTSSTDATKNAPLTAAQLAAAKLRVARPGADARPVVYNRKVTSAVQQMHARMEAVAKERKADESKETSSQKKPRTLEEQFGDKRVHVKDGRVSKSVQSSSSSKPTLLDPTSSKVPMSVRLQYLDRLYKEFLNFLSSKEAKTQAEIEEKLVLDKVKHKQGYAVAIINSLKKVRDVGEGKSTPATTTKISHDQVLLGKAYGKCTINANGPKKPVEITEEKLYEVLTANYLLTPEQLRSNSYPVWESEGKVHIEPSFYDKKRCKKTFVADFDMARVCVRCNKDYKLSMKGKIVRDNCVYHLKSKSRMPGKIRNNDARYPCCGGDDTVEGCQIGISHVCDTLRESELLKFFETPPSSGLDDPRSKKIFALDCEMVYTVWGPALARVTVVNFDGNVVLDEIIKPTYTVIDYNTTFSGITASHLETVTESLETALEKFFKLANSETILIGHSLESDLKAMRVVHNRVVDTSVLFPHRIDDQKKRGLRELCLDRLGRSIQDDIDGHDSKEDSIAALDLVIHKVKFDGKLK